MSKKDSNKTILSNNPISTPLIAMCIARVRVPQDNMGGYAAIKFHILGDKVIKTEIIEPISARETAIDNYKVETYYTQLSTDLTYDLKHDGNCKNWEIIGCL